LIGVVGLTLFFNPKLGWWRHRWSWWRHDFSKKTIFFLLLRCLLPIRSI